MMKCNAKAFAMCPTRHLCGKREDATFTDDSECAAFNRAVEDAPMTNGDKIRAMSDEKMATFINKIVICHHLRSEGHCEKCPIHPAKPCDTEGILDWLHQPAEVDDES